MPVRDWKFIEERLDSIMKDCMGKGLYNSLVDSLKGKHISFQFSTKDQASFNPQTNMLQWNRNMDSNQLFHELIEKCYNKYGDRNTLCSLSLYKRKQ